MLVSEYISNNSNLIKQTGDSYKVYFNVIPEYTIEKVFKNSAFVETGKKILTGLSKANYIWINGVANRNPSIREIEKNILDAVNSEVNRNIKCNFSWKGYNVWLSRENQINYLSWLLIGEKDPSIFPITAKFKKNGKESYYVFTSHDELADFCTSMTKYINTCVNEGRKIKDSLNIQMYKEALAKL